MQRRSFCVLYGRNRVCFFVVTSGFARESLSNTARGCDGPHGRWLNTKALGRVASSEYFCVVNMSGCSNTSQFRL